MTIPVLKYVSGQIEPDADVFIILDYMPPYPSKDTVPQKVVVWSRSCNAFVRFFEDPLWDVYGDDLGTVERAMDVASRAPKPRKPYIETTFSLNHPSDKR
jgi:hypothetical protein